MTDLVTGPAPFRWGPVALVWRPRLVLVNLALAVVVFLAFCANIGQGDFPISIGGVVEVLFAGGGDMERLVVWDLRMPRSLVGILVGIGLGISGAITQSITRNALASPDVLGITTGASAGAVAVIVFGGSTFAGVAVGVPLAAMAGGLATAGAIYLLAWSRGVGGSA